MQFEFDCGHCRSGRPGVRKLIAVAIGVLGMTAGAARADLAWQQSNDLTSWLNDSWTYAVSDTTATVTYTGQTATNSGSTAAHLGMYIGWNWVYDPAGNDTPLYWSNADQAFVGEHVSLKISRLGFTDQFLHLGDVVGDTWIGMPWSLAPDTPIATQADWNVPLFDFGTLGAGESVSYDVAFTYTFDSVDALNNFNTLYVSAQGLEAFVPEPASIVLAGLALIAAATTRRRQE